jgi:cytochrome oxidase Cu insertion factor (SCO1/SenC/PrrC family)
MAMRGLVTLVVALVIVGASAGTRCAAAGAEAIFAGLDVQQPATPTPAPDLALPDLNGRTVRLSDLRGKVVLLGFFTTT